jgi:hypothetical protein
MTPIKFLLASLLVAKDKRGWETAMRRWVALEVSRILGWRRLHLITKEKKRMEA